MIAAAYIAFALAFAVLVLAGRNWRLSWRNVALAVGVVTVIAGGWFVMNAGLSRPLPVERALLRDPARSGELLWLGQAPPDVFYLMIRWRDGQAPRYYTIPWSDELAAQLEQALQGLRDGETIGVSPFRFDGYGAGLEVPDEGVFHPLPQNTDPLKESPPEPLRQDS